MKKEKKNPSRQISANWPTSSKREFSRVLGINYSSIKATAPPKLLKILERTNLKTQQNDRHKEGRTEPNHEFIFAAAWRQM